MTNIDYTRNKFKEWEENPIKIITALLMTFSICLVACNNTKSAKNYGSMSKENTSVAVKQKNEKCMNWLVGNWHSDSWNVDYSFSEENDLWTIKDKNEIVKKNIKLKKGKTINTMEFITNDGSKIVISKVDETHIKISHVAREGFQGMTDSVEFVKK